MRSFLFVTDTHLSDTQPRTRIDDGYKSQFNKLGEIARIVRDYEVTAIYHGGDCFQTRKPSHKLIIDVIDWCKFVNVPIYCILGNHDLTGYNLDSVSNSGLGVLFESGAFEFLKDYQVYERDRIVFKAVHVAIDFQQNYMFDEKFKDYTKIAISHNYVIPTETMPYSFIHPRDIKTDAQLVLCGHYHTPFEYDTLTTKWINPGPLNRWKISEQEHQPSVLLVQVDNGTVKVTRIALKSAKPGEQVFDVELVDQEKQRDRDIQSFVKGLNDTSFTDIDLEEVVRKAGSEQQLAPEIINEVLRRIRIAKESLS